MSTLHFPEAFAWGAATAAYQIEGAAQEGGRGPSVWDMFCAKRGAVYEGHNGRVASDHYHRWEEDVSLLRGLGLSAYRFSVSWPRVLPEGIGRSNGAGLGFYDRLVDRLLEAEIVPFLTLFHWDMPLSLYHCGGWLNRDSVGWFAEYAQVLARALGDRVKHWITLNEPQVFIGVGHRDGFHAPGVRYSMAEALRCGHHALMAHGRATQVLRAEVTDASVGYAPMGCPTIPASASPSDVEAARRVMASVRQPNHWNLAWWTDPVVLGSYPEDGLELFGADAPKATEGDLELISEPIDFLGLNLYQGEVIAAGQHGETEIVPHPPGAPLTAFNWPVTPEALYWGPRYAHERYRKPIYITENGLSLRDWPSLDGRVHDPQRVDFITRHLRELHRAVAEGVDVRGYFHWSALDNFEWADGYKERFGLIYVDYASGRRIPKDSYHWYRRVIETRGAALLGDEALQAYHQKLP
jgi:beta-glucosidase